MFRSTSRITCIRSVPFRAFSFLPRLRPAPSEHSPGQFGLKGLHQPSDWQRIATVCVQDCLKLAEDIRLHKLRRDASVLQLFDDLSDRLCSVLDVAELCRNVHPNKEFVLAAHQAFVEVSTVVQHLNADHALYQPLNLLYHEDLDQRAKGSTQGSLSHEEVVMVKSLKHDFERGGINLDAGEKRRLLKLQENATSLGSDFLSASSGTPPYMDIPASILRSLPHEAQQRFTPSMKPFHLRVPIDGSMSHTLLKWIPDSRIREQVFRLSHGKHTQFKLATLTSLLQSRYDMARLLGYPSYAHLLFSDRMASSPTDVLEFLEQLSRVVMAAAHADRSAIEMEKLRKEPHAAIDGRAQVHGWDRSFYIGRLKAQNYDLSSSEVSSYLPLSACMQGLSDITSNVFGVKMIKVQPNQDEVWHNSVEKIRLVEDSGKLLGHIFLDLYPREGKYNHAAHFSIRCGRQPSHATEYQTPVVALVCNFGKASFTGDCLLTISEYETLFHEFGHSLHSIFSRTRFQHLSGTRVAMDFVEVPSHLFEHFAWDPRILSRFARHHRTGDPIPTRLVRSLCASRNGFIATGIQTQLLYSALDLRFHSADPLTGDLIQTFEHLQRSLTSFQPDEGVPVPATFHHFVGYGGGYYSYIFARVISAHLWSSLFDNNPLSRESGSNLRFNILARGGAHNPVSLLQKALRSDVSCDPFLRSTGIDVSDMRVALKLPTTKPSEFSGSYR